MDRKEASGRCDPAAAKICARTSWKKWEFDLPGGTLVFRNVYSVMSYAMARLKADFSPTTGTGLKRSSGRSSRRVVATTNTSLRAVFGGDTSSLKPQSAMATPPIGSSRYEPRWKRT